ncbi:hypothetical protein ABTH88_21090, partial [Acinetobacter baumannii]
MEAIHATPEPVPIVHLGILPLVGIVAMPKLLARMAARPGFPHLVILASTVGGVLGMLDGGEIDCMVGRIGPGREGNATSAMRV